MTTISPPSTSLHDEASDIHPSDRSLTGAATQERPSRGAANRRRETDRLIDAVVGVISETSLPLLLRRITEAACDLTGARYGALGVLGPDGSLSDFVAVGMTPKQREAIGAPPVGLGLLGKLIANGGPVRLDDLTKHPDAVGFPPHHPRMRTFLGVPIRVRGDAFGNLYLTEKRGGRPFTAADERHVLVLATAAAATIDNARRQSLEHDVAVLKERDRVSRDIHDTVIQRLYGAGIALEATRRRLDHDEAHRLAEVIDGLDATIGDLRSVITAAPAGQAEAGLRAEVLATVARVVGPLGSEPLVRVGADVDQRVSDGLAEHAVAAVRDSLEELGPVVASRAVRVAVEIFDERLVVRVESDVAAEPPTLGGSRTRLIARARALGGHFMRDDDADRTTLTWVVPLV